MTSLYLLVSRGSVFNLLAQILASVTCYTTACTPRPCARRRLSRRRAKRKRHPPGSGSRPRSLSGEVGRAPLRLLVQSHSAEGVLTMLESLQFGSLFYFLLEHSNTDPILEGCQVPVVSGFSPCSQAAICLRRSRSCREDGSIHTSGGGRQPGQLVSL